MSIATEIQRLQTAKAEIKSAIESKGVMVGDGTIDTYAEKIGEISTDGGVAINPLEYATELTETFYGSAFPDGYELTLNLPNITTLITAFQDASGIEKVIIKGNKNGNVVSFYSMFRACRTVKTLDLTEFDAKIGNAYMMFYYATEIQEVLGELDFTECSSTQYILQSCTNLVTFTPKANTIKISISFANSNKLSDLSIQSIIDGLADLTGGTAQTLTLHATVGGKLTDEQKATITAKNWTLVY